MDALTIEFAGPIDFDDGEGPKDPLNEWEPFDLALARYCWAENQFVSLGAGDKVFRTFLFTGWEDFFRRAHRQLSDLHCEKYFYHTFPDTMITLRVPNSDQDLTDFQISKSGSNAAIYSFRGSRRQIGTALLEFLYKNILKGHAKGYFPDGKLLGEYLDRLPAEFFGVTPPV